MSDSSAQEPTMEEILASIRRIISEDDAPAAAPSPAEAAAPPPPPEEEEDDVLELTEPVAPTPSEPPPPPVFAGSVSASEVMGDLAISFPPGQPPPAATPAPAPSASEPDPAPEPVFAAASAASAAPAPAASDEPLLSDPSASRAASYFGALGRHVALPAEGRTLEDLVSELLRPVLKEWLDQHLPAIVEAKVQAEVERVSRMR